MSVEVEHYGNPPEQRTVLTTTITDATGEEYTHEFECPPGGPYEYAGESEPPTSALEAVLEHVDDPDQVAHDHPDEDGDGEGGE